ncbi:hypothetical protein [Candidatus Mycoplasma haematohominis]|uniref:hypothetical protein n=1 Tax=Candidatus Mycoplasma haematohominis TaxID=1494318 RepID=UPI001C0A7794|nr:hypothetical protein [Candidatus Mycoplasma haemohominis]
MLTESKITISCSVASINAALGVSGYELLQIYLLNGNAQEELSSFDNTAISNAKISRKKSKTIAWKESKDVLDPRLHETTKTTVNDHESRYRIYRFRHISQEHKAKFVDWKDNKEWWEKTYEVRKYMLKNANFKKYVNIEGGYENLPYASQTKLHLNQFCDHVYWSKTYFEKYKSIFWLMCTTDAKNPETQEEAKIISQAKKAKFPKGNQDEEIIYLTVEQAKKTNIYNATTNSAKDKFVVYDYSSNWWEWSYQYRFQEDKKNETSAFPISGKFKKIDKGWDDSRENTTALNKVCKDFYEQTNNNSQDEIDDAWRYCSDKGEKDT